MSSNIKLTFLGTSAQIPTSKRNHTSILIEYNGENILIDCGEGTQRQFRKAKLNPGKVSKILITHLHGDHVLGIPGLLQTLSASEYKKTLYIYGPSGTKIFMKNLLKTFGFTKNYPIKIVEITRKGKFFDGGDFYLENEKMEHGIPTNAYTFVIKDKLRIDKKKIQKSKLPSGPLLKKFLEKKNIIYEGKKYKFRDFTYLENGKKISFVLDTLFNKKIIGFVKNSDLLICESSFEDSLKDLAKEHLHLTSKQAAEIAKKSKSKKLILTHISSRYENNFKKILNEAKSIFSNSILAKDFDNFVV